MVENAGAFCSRGEWGVTSLRGMKESRIKFIGATLLLVLLFICRPLAAQENGGAVTNRHSLWKVEGKSNVVYLLGSVHVLKPENYPLPAPIESAFSNAQVAVFEADVEKMSEPRVQEKLMIKARLPEGDTLKQHLSPAIYDEFARHVKECGMPMEALDTMKPSLAAIIVSTVELAKMGFDPEYGLDKYFTDKAHKEGKQTDYLETIDFQIDAVTSFSMEEEELVMKMSLKDMDKVKVEFGDIIKAWQTGDSAKLEKLLNESVREAPSIYKRLVTDRSKSWVPKIEELLQGDKNAIVIVGAAHLVGKEGVVELLKKKGWKVAQL